MEKFFDIKCRYSGLVPDCAVIVATVRALKMHGGGPPVVAGKPLAPQYTEENLPLLKEGCSNLLRHIANAKLFGVKVVVALNRMTRDTQREVDLVCALSREAGADAAVSSDHWSRGGVGALDLAKAVTQLCERGSKGQANAEAEAEGKSEAQDGENEKKAEEGTTFRFLYPLEGATLKQKIETIAKEIYGAASVEYTEAAELALSTYEKEGLGHLPICNAKTHLSLSTDPKLKGAPSGFNVVVRDARASVGAGFSA